MLEVLFVDESLWLAPRLSRVVVGLTTAFCLELSVSVGFVERTASASPSFDSFEAVLVKDLRPSLSVSRWLDESRYSHSMLLLIQASHAG